MPDTQRVLLVEDDAPLAALMKEALQKEGFLVDHAQDGKTGLARIRDTAPDIVILDVMLPELDGFEVCRSVRPHYRGPILFLTAREDDIDQVLGLEIGGDDYVIKPVRPRVLIARIRALLRRGDTETVDDETIARGVLTIHPRQRVIEVNGEEAPFTTSEFDLILYLATRAGDIVPRDDLYRALRGVEFDGIDRSIDLRVSRVRSRLRTLVPDRDIIKTVHGQGYLLVDETK